MKSFRSRFGVRSTIAVLASLVLGSSLSLPWLIPALAAAQSVTVTTTQTGTLQTQLSTNSVWAGAVESAPSGQAKLNALNAPLVRLHVGDDGGAQAMPRIRTNQ